MTVQPLDAVHRDKIAQLPEEMFTIIKSVGRATEPRLGRLHILGRDTLETPHYVATTSRGVVPHITQDLFARATGINGVYVPLEDFIEKAPDKIPPLYQFKSPDGSSPLRRFIALRERALLVLGARRTPPIIAPAANPNTNTSVSISTSVGFRPLTAEDYAEAAEKLQPDIVVGLGDIPYGRALGSKRIEKATDRNIEWLQAHVDVRNDWYEDTTGPSTELFAPLLPVSCANQHYYIESLLQDRSKDVDGLAFYNLAALEDLPDGLSHLPRLALTEPTTPHEVLQHVSLGLDVLTVPFITAATDAGIALSFAFPATAAPKAEAPPVSLGIDMWTTDHATSLAPLVEGCECYACTNHHRAYLQHLLSAKEMLAWVLLQIHNHHTLDLFFAGIRKSLEDGSFQQNVEGFAKVYESRLPEKTGQGPRIRGYQFKSEGPGEPKKNPAPFQMLDDRSEKLAESTPPAADADAAELEEQGFAEKQS
ncbi:uncharacterized protein LTR77_009708 [Saxophila tyrrhenica]|uniref:Queuine tRNA-ribosyltransferase accessory subunit 2 n=1 Tax=Saxophila tyrrhenica TaxID=1690608 RepID=A0AAV9NX30_9PEZI|nr:hypothetical protein LTR77_009708 [Saxophila tyrrhenica]